MEFIWSQGLTRVRKTRTRTIDQLPASRLVLGKLHENSICNLQDGSCKPLPHQQGLDAILRFGPVTYLLKLLHGENCLSCRTYGLLADLSKISMVAVGNMLHEQIDIQVYTLK